METENVNMGGEIKMVLISRSKSGLTCLGVGGGAYTNTFECRFVLHNGNLAKAIFIKRSGHLACSLNQAIVSIEKGDIVYYVNGRLPFKRENKNISIKAFVVSKFVKEDNNEFAVLKEIKYKHISDEVWEKIKGGIKYHNRDGSYFCDV